MIGESLSRDPGHGTDWAVQRPADRNTTVGPLLPPAQTPECRTGQKEPIPLVCTDMILKQKLALLVLATFSPLTCVSCTAQEPEQTEASTPSNEWVLRQTRVHVLERMIQEDAAQVINDSGEFSVNQLLAADVLRKEGDDYSVETSTFMWDTSDNLSEYTHVKEIDFTLRNILEENDVTWRGNEISGEALVDGYVDLHESSFDSIEEYKESIADYVDCETGEL